MSLGVLFPLGAKGDFRRCRIDFTRLAYGIFKYGIQLAFWGLPSLFPHDRPKVSLPPKIEYQNGGVQARGLAKALSKTRLLGA